MSLVYSIFPVWIQLLSLVLVFCRAGGKGSGSAPSQVLSEMVQEWLNPIGQRGGDRKRCVGVPNTGNVHHSGCGGLNSLQGGGGNPDHEVFASCLRSDFKNLRD